MRNSRWAPWRFANDSRPLGMTGDLFREDRMTSKTLRYKLITWEEEDSSESVRKMKKRMISWNSDQSQRLLVRCFCCDVVMSIPFGLVLFAMFFRGEDGDFNAEASQLLMIGSYISATKLWTWSYCWWFKHPVHHLGCINKNPLNHGNKLPMNMLAEFLSSIVLPMILIPSILCDAGCLIGED